MRRAVVLLCLLLAAGCGATPPGGEAPQGAGDLWRDAAIFTPVRAALGGATRQVLVEMYEFGRADFAELLLADRRGGLDVRVVLDPTVAVSLDTGRLLAAGGVPVRFYPVDDRAHQIDHVKLLLADDEAVVGGMNWGATSYRNHDYALVLRAPPELERLRAIFEQDWSLAGGKPSPLPPAPGDVVQTDPGSGIRDLLESSIAGAHRRLEAEIFDLTDPELLTLIVRAARRGVVTRVMLDPNQAVNRPSYSELAAAGVQVRWFHPPPGAKLHAKALLADGRLVLGSANWSLHGLDINHELDVTTTDPWATSAFATTFEEDWAKAQLL